MKLRHIIIIAALILAVLAGWSSHRRNEPSGAVFEMNKVREAVVVVFTSDAQTTEAGTGFVLGPYGLIVTAYHNTAHADDQGAHREPVVPFVFSPYWGDIYAARVVAGDPEKDIALLRADWPHHPSIPVAETTASVGSDVVLVSYIGSRGTEDPVTHGGSLSPEVQFERVRVEQPPDDVPVKPDAILLSHSATLCHGWSGCPVLTASGAVLGEITLLHVMKDSGGGAAPSVTVYPTGPSVRSILALVPAGWNEGEVAATPRSRMPEQAAEGFAVGIQATEACLRRDINKITQLATKFCELRPQSPMARLLLADALGKTFAGDSAEAALEEAHRLAPDHSVVELHRGKFFLAQGKCGDALASLERAIELDPSNLPVLQELAEALIADKQFVEAERVGRDALLHMPDNAEVANQLAFALQHQHRWDEAITLFERARALRPKWNMYRARLAGALSDARRSDEAEPHFLALTLLEPENPVVWMWYAEFLVAHRPENKPAIVAVLRKIEALDRGTPPTIPPARMEQLRRGSGL